MADLGLADAVNAAEPLLDAVRVPRQVVVDHQMRAALKVHAFAGGVVGDHHADDGIAVECRDGRAPRLARDAAVDDDDAVRANGRRDLLLKVFERVARLGEDDDLAPKAGGGVADDRVVQDRLQLPPLRVLARLL